jgi:hypothetical protein
MGETVKHTIRDEQSRRLSESMRHQLGPFCGLLDEADVIEVMPNGLPTNPAARARKEPSRGYERGWQISTFCAPPSCQP